MFPRDPFQPLPFCDSVIRRGKCSVMHTMGKREGCLSLKSAKWASSRAGSRIKESWFIIYPIHEAIHSTASKWYSSQPSHSSFWKCLCKDEACSGPRAFHDSWWFKSNVFHGVHQTNSNSCVFYLVHCNDSHCNVCHASITVMTSNVLHPVLLQWLMLMYCASLRGISIMHHFNITLYSTRHSN